MSELAGRGCTQKAATELRCDEPEAAVTKSVHTRSVTAKLRNSAPTTKPCTANGVATAVVRGLAARALEPPGIWHLHTLSARQLAPCPRLAHRRSDQDGSFIQWEAAEPAQQAPPQVPVSFAFLLLVQTPCGPLPYPLQRTAADGLAWPRRHVRASTRQARWSSAQAGAARGRRRSRRAPQAKPFVKTATHFAGLHC